jgi:uncharacterized protein (DUF302 family)
MLKGDDYGRRIVLDTSFDGGLKATTDALVGAGFQIAGRVDVRDELRRTLHHDCRRYTLLVVYAPETMLKVLQLDLAAGPALPVTVGVYELVDGEVAVIFPAPFEALSNDLNWRKGQPELARCADDEAARLMQAADALTRTVRRANAPGAGGAPTLVGDANYS